MYKKRSVESSAMSALYRGRTVPKGERRAVLHLTFTQLDFVKLVAMN
jgi:hypothetical protein